jgi:cold shock CspA family protein
MKILGKVVFWNAARGFGFLESRNTADGSITRYFLHASKIVRCLPEEGVSVNCLAQFETDPSFNPSQPVRPNDLPHALQVRISWPAQQSASATKAAQP